MSADQRILAVWGKRMGIDAGCDYYNYYINIRLCHYIPNGGHKDEISMKNRAKKTRI